MLRDVVGIALPDIGGNGGGVGNDEERSVCGGEIKVSASRSRSHSRSDDVLILGAVGCGAVLGVVARYYLTRANEEVVHAGFSGSARDDDDQRTSAFLESNLANMFACLVLGFVKGVKESNPDMAAARPALFAGISTGFCGACSTFSTFILEICNVVLLRRSAGLGIVTFLCAIAVALSVSYASLRFGFASARTFALFHRESHTKTPAQKKQTQPESASASKLKSKISTRTAQVMLWAGLASCAAALISIACTSDESAYDVVILCAVGAAPFGAWIRWAVSRKNGAYALPWMTFACNVAATAIAVGVYAALLDQSDSCKTRADISSKILSGLAAGFAGSLSTMSTFVGEFSVLEYKSACVYVFASIGAAQLVSWSILLPVGASRGCWW